MLADDEGFYLKHAKSKRDPGIYLAEVKRCHPSVAEGEAHIGVYWVLQVVAPVADRSTFRWRTVIGGMADFEDLRGLLSILDVRLRHVDEIADACGSAVGKRVFIQIMPWGGVRMLQLAAAPRRFTPFWERMERAKALRLCKQRGLDEFLGGLDAYTFLDERPLDETGRPPVMRPLGDRRGRRPKSELVRS